jgi:hypothetical protein
MEMSKHMYVIFLVLIAVLTYTISPSFARVTVESQKVDVFGYYSPQGKLPAAFAEIDHLHLSTIDSRGNSAPLSGFIRPKRKAAQDYRLVQPKLEGKKLTFKTRAVRGISYSFDGTFTKLGNFPVERPEGEVLLNGHLIKMRKGKKVAETDVSFTYSGGD